MIYFVNIIHSYFQQTVGTLTPDGTVPLDCGSQQTFTCGVNGTAAWNISGLSGVRRTPSNGLGTAHSNPRITTTDTNGITSPSTITITGFTTSDNGGTIQCINLNDNSVQGMASIPIGERLLRKSMNDYSDTHSCMKIQCITTVLWS